MMKVGDLVRIKSAGRATFGYYANEVGLVVRWYKNLGTGPYILWANRAEPRLFGRVDFLELVSEAG